MKNQTQKGSTFESQEIPNDDAFGPASHQEPAFFAEKGHVTDRLDALAGENLNEAIRVGVPESDEVAVSNR
jgi:hypothetical protein